MPLSRRRRRLRLTARYQHNQRRVRHLAQPRRDLKTIEVRKPDVEQYQLRSQRCCADERRKQIGQAIELL